MSHPINYRVMMKVVSLLVIFTGLFMSSCIGVAYLTGGRDAQALVISTLITLTTGGLLWLSNKKVDPKEIGKREAYAIVVIAWVAMSVFGSLPYLFSGAISSFTSAFFESISGFTTTGASVLTDIEAVSKGVLFWRSLTHWIGGMGIVVFSIALLPFLGIGGMQLFIAEVPGPTKDKLHPRITQTARRLWVIYLMLTFLQVIMLIAGKMSLYDAVCHSFATVSSGGFSTRNASMGAFSPYIQYVTIFFMIMAGTNFTLHYKVLHSRWKEMFGDEEWRTYLGIILISSLIIAINLIINSYASFEKSFRDALFQVSSIVTCTGFGTADYMQWPQFTWFLIFILMFVGGCAGSTAGGIKVIRHLLLLKNSQREFKVIMHPSAYVPLFYNGHSVNENIRNNIFAIFLLYMITFTLGAFLLMISGLDKLSAMGSVVTAMGNIGPGLNLTGPALNFANVNIAGKWILSALMLIGRLELFTVYILFMKAFWKR